MRKYKLVIIALLVFLCTFSFGYKESYGIYRETLNTKVYLSILDPSSMVTVSFVTDGGTSVDPMIIPAGSTITAAGGLPTTTKTDYNFLGWYKSDGVTEVDPDEVLTSNVTYTAHWIKIVCKKVTNVNNLNTETCAGANGCATSGTGYSKNAPNNVITYGTIFGDNSPQAGDAYDCDVYYDASNVNYDQTDQYGKHIERFYFVREKEIEGSENTAVLIYYTSFDSNGRVDSQHTLPNSNIGSDHYDVALGWLPNSDTWENPGLVSFGTTNDDKEKITRFLTVDDLETVCGPLNNDGTANTAYLTSCFNKNNEPNWFMFENSRFQSSSLGRAGIWLEADGTTYYRIQTSALAVGTYTSPTGGDNMARPVIEIPMSALEGYTDATRYEISFNTHDGTAVSDVYYRYDGDEIGTLPTTTREHYNFDGWYATYENGVYSDLVTSSTVVHSDMTLHAKWTLRPTCTVTLNLNGGTGLTSPATVYIGELYSPGTPTKEGHNFAGWFTNEGLTIPYDDTVPISTSTLTLYASWTAISSYAAMVEGVGSYATLAEAIEHVPTGNVKTKVTLLKDITISEAITIPSGKWVELDIGERTITGSFSGTGNMISNSGKLDIISGTMIFTNSTAASKIIVNNSGSTLNISGNCILTNEGINVGNSTVDHPVIENTGGTVNITGGTLNSNGLSATINNKSGTLNVSGGEIIAHSVTKGQAIYMEGGTVNISGNAYLENTSGTGDSRATVDNNGGTLIITGGTIVSNGYSAVIARKNGKTTRIGTDGDVIDVSTPVLRGKRYGLEVTAGNVSVYDGIFESLDNTRAVSGSVTKPTDIDFFDSTITVGDVTYHSTYLLAPKVTVRFDANGGTVEGESYKEIEFDNGDVIGTDMPDDPIKANYYFDGWYDGSTKITSSTEVTYSLTAYARWVQSVSNATISNTLSVVKDSDALITIGGNDIEGVTYSSSDNSVATVSENGVVSGVALGSATITITGKKSGDTRTVTVTVTPVMHTVTFLDEDNETEIYVLQIADETSFGQNMPANPTDENMVFSAWYIDGEPLNLFNSSTTVTDDLTVVASWKEKISYATLSTSSNPFEVLVGGTGQITLTAKDQGDTVESYTFSSNKENVATVNSSGQVTGVGVGSATITITGGLSGLTIPVSVTVDVLKYTVTFKDGNEVIDTIRVQNETAIGALMINDPTKTNYIFDGWFVDGDSQYPVTNQTVVRGDIIAVASWTPSIRLATIPDTLDVAFGGTNTISVNGPNGMESYTFTSEDSAIASVDANGVVTGVALGTVDIIVTGSRSTYTKTVEVTVSTAPIITRTVTFKDDDNITVLGSVSDVIDGDSLGSDMPANPTRENYFFNGWYIDGNLAYPFNSSTSVTGDLVVVASWKAKIGISSVTTSPSPLRVKLGTHGQITVTGPTGGLVEDYTFSSSNNNIAYSDENGVVYTEDVGTVIITITGTVSTQTKQVEVIVHNNNTLTFDPDNGGDPTVIEVPSGSSISASGVTLPTSPTKDNYVFDNWYYYDGSDVTTTPIDENKIITQDEVYKPRWASANSVAAIGTSYYTTLQAAINAVTGSTKTEIRVLQDISNPSGRTTVSDSRDIVINANGHTLSCGGATSNNLLYANGGTLTVKNGTFTCNKSGLATLETAGSSTIYIEDGTIVTNTGDRGAVYNSGTTYVLGGTVESSTGVRSTITNGSAGAVVEVSGGTVKQTATSYTSDSKNNGKGAIKVDKGTVRVTGGTVISNSTNSAAIDHSSTGTLVIGTMNGTYDTTSPVIQGEQYGINASKAYSVFDGIIKGKTNGQAVNVFSNVDETNGIETGSERRTGTDDSYYTLYYEMVQNKYHIDFNANDGTVDPTFKEFSLNTAITASDLPTPTRALHTFAGWYTDSNLETPFATFTPTTVATVTYYAKWNFNSSNTAVPFRITSNAMNDYFTNVSSWVTTDLTDSSNNNSDFEDRHQLYKSSISSSFTNNSCSACNGPNTCSSPGAGTYCEQSRGYDTGLEEDLDVYLYKNNAKDGLATYVTVNNGVIYNMIPGVTYYWESHNDSTKYGVVTATGQRRTIYSSVRNVRDLGGLAADTDNDGTPDGTIKYGVLYRGAQITTSAGVDSLVKLGITREIDLRGTGDNGAGTQPHFGDSSHLTNQNSVALKYDIDIDDTSFSGTTVAASNGNIGYKDVIIRNYLINPTTTDYYTEDNINYYREFKKVLKKTMQYAVNGDSIYFHCTIGTDRTGTLAYFLEGLLGVSLEDRVRDYELTYYFGLTNRHRFHNYLSGSSWNPRFYAMYMSYPDYDDIYDYYTFERDSDDDTLLAAFKAAMIE